MAKSWFEWNGTRCGDKHLRTNGAAQKIRPEERAEHVTIPGRRGDLTKTEGEKIYNSYIQTLTIITDTRAHADEAERWLSGEGWITFSSDPERKQRARVIGAVSLNKYSRNMDYWSGEVQFYCDPEKAALTEPADVTLNSAGTVVNGGDYPALPKITVTCPQNDCVLITVGGKAFTVELAETGLSGCVIDSAAEIVTSPDGTQNLTGRSDGEFPVLPAGSSMVDGEWTKLVIKKRERYV